MNIISVGTIICFNCFLYIYKFVLYKQLSDYIGTINLVDYSTYWFITNIFMQLFVIRVLYGYLCNKIELDGLKTNNMVVRELINGMMSYNIDYYKSNNNLKINSLWSLINSKELLITKLLIELPKIVAFILYFSYLIYMYSYVAFLLIIPLSGLSMFVLNNLTRRHYLEYNTINNVEHIVKNKMFEVYNNMEKVKLYNCESLENNKLVSLFNNYTVSKMNEKKNIFYMGLVTDLISESFIYIIYFIGVSLIFNKEINPIDILYLAVHTNNFYYNLVQFRELCITNTKTNNLITKSLNSLNYDKFDSVDMGDLHISRDSDKISFVDVSFGYNNDLVFENINFDLYKDKINLLLGPNGSGKSTIIKLLLKFYSKYGGLINYFGSNLSDIPTSYIRKNITFISNDYSMFDDTVIGNIMYGVNCDFNKVLEVSELLDASDWVLMNKDKQVGFRGNNLTLGEKKKIQLINAICRDTPVLIFDEPSNSLDSHALQWFINFVKRLRDDYGKTIIIASHDMRLVGLEDNKVSLI